MTQYCLFTENYRSFKEFSRTFVQKWRSIPDPLQFEVFRWSPILKYHFQFLAILASAILAQVLVVVFVEHFAEFSKRTDEGEDSYELNKLSHLLIYEMRIYHLLCMPLALSFPLQTLIDAKFRKLSIRKFSLLTCDSFLNLIIVISGIVIYQGVSTLFYTFSSIPVD